jgi:hypothetical protein
VPAEREPSAATTPRSRATVLVALLLAALPWLLFRQYVSDDLFLYGYDAGQSHYARFKVIGSALRDEGGLALWQTGSYGGSPFHANLENPTLYPPIVLLAALLPPLLALNLTVLLHLSLGTVGMFLLTLRLWRRISGGAPTALAGAALGGVLYGLNAFTRVDTFNLVIYGAAHALIPWIVLAADAVLRSCRPRSWAAVLAVLLAAQIHTGAHWVYTYTAVALAAWWLVEGLAAGPGPRRAALLWFPVAGLLALLLVMPKLLPFVDWVGTTNRAGALDPAAAKGLTIAGEAGFSWRTLLAQAGQRTSGGLPLLFLPFTLLMWRHRTVRLVLVLALLGVVIAAGLLHDVLLSHLPPFDLIRGAFRGWTLANAFLALAAGLGACRLVELLRWPARPRAREALALLLVPAALPALLATGRHQEIFEDPYSFRHVLGLYPHWTEAARLAGDEWRVMSLDVQEAGTRNEQFIAAALDVETLAGFFGFAYPQAIARHAYCNDAPLDPALRRRRVGLLSVRYATVSEDERLRPRRWDERLSDPYPGGIDGTRIETIEDARPRAFLPRRVAAVVGDVQSQALYALLDAPEFRPERLSFVVLDAGAPPTAEELASFDAIVLVEGAAFGAPGAIDAAPEATRVRLPLAATDRARLHELAARLSHPPDPGLEVPTHFERHSSREVHAGRADPSSAAWLVLSETWSLYDGWTARSDRGRELPIRRADGVVSAAFLLPGEAGLIARYEPASVHRGLLLGSVGLLGVLVLLWPRRRAVQRT